jgi:pimeloyl-ACP methyl ester carboxylesterase
VAPYRERRLAAQDGLSLYYRDYGDPLSRRLPLICLTGLTRNSADFADLADRHADERRILCLDYRGRGRSAYDSDWRNYDPRIYVSDIVHLLAANDVDRAVIVGTSMGGVLTMALAVLKPTALAAAVLNDIGPDVIPGGLVRIMGYIGTDQPQPDWPTAVRYLQKLLPTLSIRSDEGWLKMAKATFREGDDSLLHFDWDVKLAKPLLAQSGGVPDLWPFFSALRRVPTLVLRGALSDVLSPETFQRMALVKPDLERVTVPNSGHAPTLNEPEAAAAIDAFIRRF